MDEEQFRRWMNRRPCASDAGPPVTAQTILLKARLRRRMAAEERATRPIRIAEGIAVLLGWMGIAAAFGPDRGITALLTVGVMFAAAFRVMLLKKA